MICLPLLIAHIRLLPMLLTFALLSIAPFFSSVARAEDPAAQAAPAQAPPVRTAAIEPVKVSIDNFSFNPATLTIKPGTAVTFVNHDDIPHSIVNPGGKFRSKVLDTDQSFTFTFATAGDFDYFCGLHPHMKGRIVVAP